MNSFHAAIPKTEMPIATKKCAFIDEEMVDLAEYFPTEFYVESAYYRQGITGAAKQCMVRLGVAKRLEKAMKLLPQSLTFKVFDAWRPIAVQAELYAQYRNCVQERHPNWSAAQIDAETAQFVSAPRWDMDFPAVHSTGGAIDLTLADKRTGLEADMGTAFDDFTPQSHTIAFEGADNERVRENRRLLYWVMTEAGFVNLPSEWWHYDYGDSFWGYYKKKPAIYRGIAQRERKEG